jgi:hypothetical protein
MPNMLEKKTAYDFEDLFIKTLTTKTNPNSLEKFDLGNLNCGSPVWTG